jgi:peptide/nickel transport system permease protein
MVDWLPGDIAYIIGGEGASQQDIESIRKDLGRDRNLVIRYFFWLGNLLRGDLGNSYLTQEPVLNVILERLPVTIELLFVSQLIALMLALPAGIVSAYRKGSLIDRLINISGFATLSIPSFIMALVTIYLFAIQLRWLPATGYTPVSYGIWENVKSFILPGISIALIEWVALMRMLRSDMIDTLQQNYILMARAKGLPKWKILLNHALRPSSFTLVTLLGIQIGRLIGGAVIVETIFALPGIGRLLVTSIYSRDVMIIQGCVLLITIAYVSINTVVDILYHILDPRIGREPSNAG